jgi:hypothetical protein
MHEKNIQVRRMIGYYDEWPLREPAVLLLSDPIETKDPHHPAPKNENPESLFFPGRFQEYVPKKGIEKDGKDHKDDPDVDLPDQG